LAAGVHSNAPTAVKTDAAHLSLALAGLQELIAEQEHVVEAIEDTHLQVGAAMLDLEPHV